jgi:hypothetical protein
VYIFVGTGVVGWHQHSSDDLAAYNQFWFIIPTTDGQYNVVFNLATGTVLEIMNGLSCRDLICRPSLIPPSGDVNNGAMVECWPLNAPTDPNILHQQWKFVPTGTVGNYM